MPTATKKAPRPKAPPRIAFTIKLTPASVDQIEKAAAREDLGARAFLREYIEKRFR